MNKPETKIVELTALNIEIGTVTQATDIGKEFIEAQNQSKVINTFIFDQLDNKTSKQMGFIIGDIRRFLNVIEYELHVDKKTRFLAEKYREERMENHE